jgi:hypothetical protein
VIPQFGKYPKIDYILNVIFNEEVHCEMQPKKIKNLFKYYNLLDPVK